MTIAHNMTINYTTAVQKAHLLQYTETAFREMSSHKVMLHSEWQKHKRGVE